MTETISSERMPTMFIGHGSPMNALEHNEFTESWAELGRRTGKPRAIVVISAHWWTRGTAVTAMGKPQTIHDFGAFPQSLFDVRYNAAGDEQLAMEIVELLSEYNVVRDVSWGLDHGTWSVLVHAYPEADVPVVQLSMDMRKPLSEHYVIGRKIAKLRDRGILVLGSGNVVHNLPQMTWAQPSGGYDWAESFQGRVREIVAHGSDVDLFDLSSFGREAALSVPSVDHFLPLLYILGARDTVSDDVEFITPKCIYGSLSMMSIAFWPH